MRDKTIIPTNLLDWPRCRRLLPEQRLMLLWLWSCQYMTSAGVGFIPIPAAAATLGLDPQALDGGLDTLKNAQLIARDHETGEVFILDWFRFHTFRQGVPARAAQAAIDKVQSASLKVLILEKSKACLPTATITRTVNSSLHASRASAREEGGSPPPGAAPAARACRKKTDVQGIVCWTDRDREAAAALVSKKGVSAVTTAVAELERQGVEPLPTRVEKILKGKNYGKRQNDSENDVIRQAIALNLRLAGLGDEHVIEGERVY